MRLPNAVFFLKNPEEENSDACAAIKRKRSFFHRKDASTALCCKKIDRKNPRAPNPDSTSKILAERGHADFPKMIKRKILSAEDFYESEKHGADGANGNDV